jgi:hypothetical protein
MTSPPVSASLDATHGTLTDVPERDRISRAEAALLLGVSVQTVDRYAAAGTLHPEKNPVTQRVWYDRREVEDLADARGPGR